MPLQNFVDNSTPVIGATWLNQIDVFVNTLFGGATTAAQARTALGSTATGDAVFIAASAAAGRTALGAAASGANTDITSLNAPALGAATATTQAASDNTTKVATTAQVQLAIAAAVPVLSKITASLGADVNLNNTANYFDGPSVAQGSTGTWFASGTVTITDPGTARIHAKLWDGTTVIAATLCDVYAAGEYCTIALSGYLTSPAGNLRISVKDVSTVNGKIIFNASGTSKDSTITALRIA